MTHRSRTAIALLLLTVGTGPFLCALEGSVQFGLYGEYESDMSPAFSAGPESAVSISTLWFPDRIVGVFFDAAVSAYYDPLANEFGTAILIEPALSLRGTVLTVVLDARTFFGARSSSTSATLLFTPRMSLSVGSVDWALELAPSATLDVTAGSGNLGADLTGSLLIGAVWTLDTRFGVYYLYGTNPGVELSGGAHTTYFAPGGAELDGRADIYRTLYESSPSTTAVSARVGVAVPTDALVISSTVPVALVWTDGTAPASTVVTVEPTVALSVGLSEGISLVSELSSSLRFFGANLDRWSLALSADIRFRLGE